MSFLRWIFLRSRQRRARHPAEELALAPLDLLIAEGRRRAASLPLSRAGARLATRTITDEAELLVLLRALRIQVCASFAGLARYYASDVHTVVLALRLREQRRDAAGSGLRAGVFR